MTHKNVSLFSILFGNKTCTKNKRKIKDYNLSEFEDGNVYCYSLKVLQNCEISDVNIMLYKDQKIRRCQWKLQQLPKCH